MIRLIAFAVFALALATSAQALPRVPLHQPDGMTTQVRYYGYGHRPTATAAIGTTAIGTTATAGIGTTATAIDPRYGYRHYGYGYRHYGYRPYGYGVARGIARRNIRRGILR